MDPFSVLGVDADVSEAELAAAYRDSAKTRHPDHGGDASAMALLNEAYELARGRLRRDAERHRRSEVRVGRRPDPGAWLPQPVREALGLELLLTLDDGEPVQLVTRAGRSGSGPATLALTDRRLLWVLEDAVSARVDWVRFGIVARVERRRGRLGRRSVLRLRTRTGRRVTFGDLEPAAAETIAERLASGAVAA